MVRKAHGRQESTSPSPSSDGFNSDSFPHEVGRSPNMALLPSRGASVEEEPTRQKNLGLKASQDTANLQTRPRRGVRSEPSPPPAAQR